MREREGGRFCPPTLFLRSAREPPSRRTRVLWAWLFWQARCRAVFPAWEGSRQKEAHVSNPSSAGLYRAGLAGGRGLLTEESRLTFSASRSVVPGLQWQEHLIGNPNGQKSHIAHRNLGSKILALPLNSLQATGQGS